ncbi:MAG: PAS domain-containing protein, partial [Rhodocyclaceae bacterium]
MSAGTPTQDTRRLRLLQELGFVDPPSEPAFDAITQFAAQLCSTPIAVFTVLDGVRHWVKSSHGLDGVPKPAWEIAFCAVTILQREPLEVPDAELDARFRDNPAVRGEAGWRFYHGITLSDDQGYALGTLGVVDRRPRSLSAEQRRSLAQLATVAQSLCEGRRKTVEAALLESFFDQTPGDVYLCSALDTRYLFANRTVRARQPDHAASLAELRNTTLLAHQTWMPAADLAAELRRLYRGEIPAIEFESWEREAGGTRPVLVRIVRYMGGPLDTLCVVVTDITERLAAQAALRDAETRWQFALDAAGHGVWDWDVPSGKVFYSHAWKAMLGYADEEIGDSLESWKQRVHPGDLAATYADIERHLLGETDQYATEHRMRAKDGSYRWVLDRGKVISRDVSGAPLRIIGTYTDITDRKLLQQRLEESNAELENRVADRTGKLQAALAENLAALEREKGLNLEIRESLRELEMVSATLSHDLRAPLRAVAGFLDVIGDERDLLSLTGQQALERAQLNSRRISTMVQTILDFLREARQPVQLKSVNPIDLFAAAWHELSPLQEGRTIEFINGSAPQCLADANLLRIACDNLLANALK